MTKPVGIAIVGCGYISPSYLEALPHHPELALRGAFDIDAGRLASFRKLAGCAAYEDLEGLLADPETELVLNLTNPRSHYEINRRVLEASKHVYSEKPLGMSGGEAELLVALARDNRVLMSCAPCSMLSETARTLEHALKSGVIGKPRLAYAEFDDGMIAPNQAPWTWVNELGVPWPARDEFEIGCTYEHAGYVLTWLASLFGPALRLTSFASCQIPDKGIAVGEMAPDFTVGCLEFSDGMVARVTCGLVAERNKSLTIYGDEGVLRIGNVRHEHSAVLYRKYRKGRVASAVERRVGEVFSYLKRPSPPDGWLGWRTYPYITRAPGWLGGPKAVDFLRGAAEMAVEIRGGPKRRLTAELGWHVAEIVQALQHPGSTGRTDLKSAAAMVAAEIDTRAP